MGLNWEPEPAEKMAKRFETALKRVYDVDLIAQEESDRPGEHRENVFDFKDGIRIIVSLEIHDGVRFVHISGSSQNPMSVQDLSKRILGKIITISKMNISGVVNAWVANTGIIHFLFRMAPEWADKVIKPPTIHSN